MNMRNYRPISLVSIVPKLCENLVSKKMISLINKYFISEQFAFRFSTSTQTNLLTFHIYIHQALQSGNQVDVINNSNLVT